MKILLLSLSFLSFKVSSVSISTFPAKRLTRLEFMQFMSMGSCKISYKFSLTYMRLSSTSPAIWRKSDEIRMEIAVLTSIAGLSPWTYFISQSKMEMSQWTEISMSSNVYWSLRYFSKYFMVARRSVLSHLKSYVRFLASSQTWISTWFFEFAVVSAFEPTILVVALWYEAGCPGVPRGTMVDDRVLVT